MCGIAGKINLKPSAPIDPGLIYCMLDAIRHRGPDDYGVFVDDQVGIGSARLSIIDVEGGHQPISNEDNTIWIVFNGEIYNYLELRSELVAKGHVFRTHSDTEALVHLYEEDEENWLLRLNGQFAIALWDGRQHKLILARDRLGVRPIYYTVKGTFLLFGSEAKALFAHPDIPAKINPISLAQIFTFWTTLSPRSAFSDILSIPPGHYAVIKEGDVNIRAYWRLDMEAKFDAPSSLDEAAAYLRWLLEDAIRLRLRSDVPVGTYLSGGLDSSSITMLASKRTETKLKTFSIAFSDQSFDESHYQATINEYLGVDNDAICCTFRDIGEAFPEAIRYCEMPLLRTAPVPMFLLSKLVHEHGFKVVLTGEGADELLGGYDIFKEMKIRRFWARQPTSRLRPLLLHRLYPYIDTMGRGGDAYLRMFFGQGLSDTAEPLYSHRLRWQNTARCWRFFSPALREEIKGYNPLDELSSTLPAEFKNWSPFAQAQYLEITIFLSEYLLSSQGDRMGMAHSVEGRYPFLDPRIVDYSVGLPAHYKMCGLREKTVLRRAMRGFLPPATLNRYKQPYRAPIRSVFFGDHTPAFVGEYLSPEKLAESGYFEPAGVKALIAKCQNSAKVSETEEMALVGILSTQLLDSIWRS
ncbi:MAG: asparagine synthase (glutamine-hydrolyzing) [candidate division KSB1 bacterium]|nr:asparagine synthase (glutamine-hydrolyzing) [candidate division KSB1 bacterium]